MEDEIDFIEYEESIELLFPPEFRYTFLVGAGVSMDFPTNIPSAREVVKSLLEICVPPEEVECLLSLNLLRYELVVEKIQVEIDEDLRFLDYLELVTNPNIIHYFLGNAITRGNHVVTTNFDYMIEHALMRILDKESHKDIIPVITKEDFIFYQDPTIFMEVGKYLLYKIHGSKQNIITGIETKESLITTISALGREREEGKTFAIEPYKKDAVYKLMKHRTLVTMGYSGSDDFDISPTLKELPFLKRLIWIEHTQSNNLEIIHINQIKNLQDKEKISDLENKLLEISIKGEFEVILIRTDTNHFIKTKLWGIFLPHVQIQEMNLLESELEVPKFSSWIKEIYGNIAQLQKYKLAIQLYYFLKQTEASKRCSEKGLKLSDETNDLKAKSYFLNFLGLIDQITGKYNSAITYYEEGLRIDELTNDIPGTASALGNIGAIYLIRGRYDLALENYKKALDISEKSGDLYGMVTNLNNIGRINEIHGDLEIALSRYKEAMKLTDRIGDLNRKAALLNNIGMVHGTQNRYDLALQNYEVAIKIVDNLGDLYGKIILLNNIGRVYDEYSNYEKALEKYKETITIAEKLGDLSKKAGSLNNIGSIHLAQGNDDLALEKYQEALNIEERLGNPLMKLIYLNNIGMVYNNRKEYNLALKTYTDALEIAKMIGDLSKKGLILTKIGAIYMIQDKIAAALESYETSLLIFGETGELSNKAASLSNIGKIYEKFEEHHEAIKVYEEALQIDTKLEDLMGKASDLYNLGRVYEIHGELRKALSQYEESLNIFSQLNQDQYVNTIQQNIINLRKKIG